ncbi:hypothetical protein [Mycobacterium sp. 852002-50816_SCH5313054-b]|uniref:hypothetical protein n=1 Tax=Mycobacterium sp. 852002-50816_SCH5313054-b TaxID=1834092 RepID=UPI000AEF5C9A|nr:hypothetical protein [Mycobacterium sp. 852002-50816_SCH5313054-b]
MPENRHRLCNACYSAPAEPAGWRCTTCARARPNPSAPNALRTAAAALGDTPNTPDVLTASWQADDDVFDDGVI